MKKKQMKEVAELVHGTGKNLTCNITHVRLFLVYF